MQSTKEEEVINLISHGRFPVLSSLPVGGHVQLWMFVLYLHDAVPVVLGPSDQPLCRQSMRLLNECFLHE